MTDPLKYVRPNILRLQPYSTARDEFGGGEIDVWLDANESPYENGVNRYPDPRHRRLKEKISEIKGVPADMIFIGGAGSDEAIDLTYRIFCTPGKDKVIIPSPTYGVYGVAADINDIKILDIPLGKDFSLPVEEILKVSKEETNVKLVWVCSPNNPTGNAFSKEEIIHLADNFNGIVAVDEAYVDFSSQGSLLHDIKSHPNLIVLHTFSKAWGMAGLRCGMAFAVPEIASLFNRVKYPYNLNGPTQERILHLLETETPTNHVEELLSQREWMAGELKKLTWVRKVNPSEANFLLVEVAEPDEVYDYLVANGIIVRNRSRVRGCGPTLRFTIGTPDENRRVIALLQNYKK
ncbi:MAG: histidinol-phosphate transaminase [Muribaculaceae bacterium]|nr:histidinol-phosphate transaminase [Muribaculaceae bacterium]